MLDASGLIRSTPLTHRQSVLWMAVYPLDLVSAVMRHRGNKCTVTSVTAVTPLPPECLV